MSYNGYYVSFPRTRREFDSLHLHQWNCFEGVWVIGFDDRNIEDLRGLRIWFFGEGLVGLASPNNLLFEFGVFSLFEELVS